MAKKVFLGVGHGGYDPGAIGNGFYEKDLNLSIALACQAELVRHGVTVGMSRTKDENDDLNEEIRECNAFNPDLALDIHNNAGGGDGAEAYYHHGGGTGKVLAENILAEIQKIGQNCRGAFIRKNDNGDDWYGFIRLTNAPAVIVECAFIDNAKDIQVIDTEEERRRMGVALAKGILKTLGIAYEEETPEPAPSEESDEDVTVTLTTLCKGSKGEQVKTLQRLLMTMGYSVGVYGADGDFGGATEGAVLAFQNAKGLGVDGIVGQNTWNRLLKG